MKSIKILLTLFILLLSISSYSQKYEIGPSLGFTNVFGDQDNYQWSNAELGGGLIYKVNKNYRWSYRFSYHYLPTELQLPGSTDNAGSFTPGNQIRIHEIAGGIEFNFFEYQKPHKRTNSTPYFILQVAAMHFDNDFSASIPIGLGFKTKLFSNIAIAIETRLNYSFSDDLEGGYSVVPDLNNRNDWYMFTGINLMYIFGRQECYTSPM